MYGHGLKFILQRLTAVNTGFIFQAAVVDSKRKRGTMDNEQTTQSMNPFPPSQANVIAF